MSGPTGPAGTDAEGANVPERVRKVFPGISSRAYEHPADRAALVTLRAVPGFDTFLRVMAGAFSERRVRMMFLASGVRVGEQQFSEVHRIHADCVRILDLGWEPELYVVQDPRVNARTLGLDKPFIVINTGLLDLLDDEELRVVIGHELGHVLSGHALYSSVLFFLMELLRVGTWLPLGNIGLRAIVEALREWFRKAELSCDRAGLLVSQDPGAAMRVHMKIAGGARVEDMNLVAFLDQAEEYTKAGDVRDSVIRILNLLGSTHPFSVVRALELRRWIEAGDYERILAGTYPLRADDPATSFTEEMKAAARSYKESIDNSDDPLMKFIRDLGDTANAAGGWFADRVRNATRPRDRDRNGGDSS
jgi:Zn-dependent protease with chaperone function